jgi:hypothetical protein
MDSAADQLVGYGNLVAFANDGVISENELSFMKQLALRDGVVDDDERAVLQRLFSRVDKEAEDPAVREKIEAFCRRYGLHEGR